MSATSTLHQSEDRAQPRYLIGSKKSPAATVFYLTDGKEYTVQGKLLDVSLGGICMEMRTGLEKEQRVVVVLQLPSIRGELRMEGWVTWSQPSSQGRWIVGCRLDSRISDEAINEMAKSKIIDRRQDERWTLGQSVSMRVELRDEPVVARLVNFSVGGYQFITTDDVELEIGSRVLLQRDENGSIPAKVVWTRKAGNCTISGCCFLSRKGFDAFSELVPDEETKKRVGHFLRWRGIWLAVLAIVFVQVVSMLALRVGNPAKENQGAKTPETIQQRDPAQDNQVNTSPAVYRP